MLHRYTLLLAAVLLVSFTGCKKKEVTGPQGPVGPAGPSFKGVVAGHVSVYDQFGSRVVYNYLPINVILKGYDTVQVDSVGYFHFDSVVTGGYKLDISGADFGGTEIHNIQIVKDTLYVPVKVSLKPSFDLTSFTATRLPATSEVSLDMDFPVDTRARNCIVFVGKNPDVSGNANTYLLSYVIPLKANVTKASMKIPVSDLNNARIFYGEQVYFAAYSYVLNDASVYIDEVTGRNMYTAIGARLADTTLAP